MVRPDSMFVYLESVCALVHVTLCKCCKIGPRKVLLTCVYKYYTY